MKNYYLALLSFLISISAIAQQSTNNTAEYNGQKYPASIIEFELPADETEKVVKEIMKSQGYNPEKSKGYLVYRNVKLADLDMNSNHDVLFKIERKSRKENNTSVVTMIAAKSGQIPDGKVKGAKIVADINTPSNSASFLKGFQSSINLAAYNLEIERQINEVAKAEKSLENLVKDQGKLEKKIKDLQDELAQNQKNQEVQVEEVARQKQLLDEKKQAPPVE